MNIQNEIYGSVFETANDSVPRLVWGLCIDSIDNSVWETVAISVIGPVKDSSGDNIRNYVRETINEYEYLQTN
jgi:hypothetical protein